LAGSRGSVYIAPGRDVPTTQPGGRWFLVNGSSFAAAHVSGLFALVRQRSARISPTLVAERGFVDACATMAYAGLNCECACAPGPARAMLRR
jgi:subtilisin family serine protease